MMYGDSGLTDDILVVKANTFTEDDDLLSIYDTGGDNELEKAYKRAWYKKCILLSFLIASFTILCIIIFKSNMVNNNHGNITNTSKKYATFHDYFTLEDEEQPIVEEEIKSSKDDSSFLMKRNNNKVSDWQWQDSTLKSSENVILLNKGYEIGAESCVNNILNSIVDAGKTAYFISNEIITLNEIEYSIELMINKYGDLFAKHKYHNIDKTDYILKSFVSYSFLMNWDLGIESLKINADSSVISLLIGIDWNVITNNRLKEQSKIEIVLNYDYSNDNCVINSIDQLKYEECKDSQCNVVLNIYSDVLYWLNFETHQ